MAPIYHTRWERMTLYNNINNTHTHTHTCRTGNRHGCEEDSLEIGVEEMSLWEALTEGGRIRVAECLRQTVPNSWASVRKRSFTQWSFVFTRGVQDSGVGRGT